MTVVEGATAAKVAVTAAAGAVAAAVASPPPADPNLGDLVVLGVPVLVLAAAIVGAGIRYVGKPSKPECKVPRRMVATACDALIGAWLAMLLLGLPATAGHIGTTVRPEVVGAVCALSVQYLRTRVAEWGDTLVRNVLSWLGKRERTP